MDLVAEYLRRRNSIASVEHIQRLLERGEPRLMPSAFGQCPLKAALSFVGDRELLEYHRVTGATAQDLLEHPSREEFDANTLALFYMGHVYEDLLVPSFAPQASTVDASGYLAGGTGQVKALERAGYYREFVLDDGLWRGRVDLIMYDQFTGYNLYEFKSTRRGGYSYIPQKHHLAQLHMYCEMFEEIYGIVPETASLVYIANDVHPSELLSTIQVFETAPEFSEADLRAKNQTEQYLVELGGALALDEIEVTNPPHTNPDKYPCGWCNFKDKCHSPQAVIDRPF